MVKARSIESTPFYGSFKAFVTESNRIEGITRPPTAKEIRATEDFVALKEVSVGNLQALVGVYTGGQAVLRDKVGYDVKVGSYYPPRGGPEIRIKLTELLKNLTDPYIDHLTYEALHPFTDGNGRSGRALWLWQRGGVAPLGFLHHFYYETLSHAPRS